MSRVNATANYAGAGVTTVHVDVPSFNPTYLRQMFRHRSTQALMPLFAKACDPAKEWTESMSAWAKLRKWLKEPTLALHIGDGAHSRTAAFFAFHSAHENVNIDPVARRDVIDSWQKEIKLEVQRLAVIPERAEVAAPEKLARWASVVEHITERKAPPALLTFVHAHVNTRDILASLPKGSWAAAYTCACCHPKDQLVAADDPDIRVLDDGEDWGILSSQRRYQVLVPREAKPAMSGDLRPCRSPYCECDPGKCSHPGCYDARGEA